MSRPQRKRKTPDRFGDLVDEKGLNAAILAVPLQLRDERWKKAVEIVAEKRERKKKPVYLVKFAGSDEPEEADKVSKPLLARWRIKQQSGEAKGLEEFLGVSKKLVGGAVSSEDLATLIKTIGFNVNSCLKRSMRWSPHNSESGLAHRKFIIPCKPKEFFALFPDECPGALASLDLLSVMSSHGYAIALSLAEARELIDPHMPGWWYLRAPKDAKCLLLKKDKRVTFSLRMRGATDFTHEACPKCTKHWNMTEMLGHKTPTCCTTEKLVKIAGIGELTVNFHVLIDQHGQESLD